MAITVIPKSEFRRNDNIIVGYGEVPAIDIEGQLAWGIPGKQFTFNKQEAIQWAMKLDELIRQNLNTEPDKKFLLVS